MTVEGQKKSQTWRVGIVGLESVGLFLLEQMSLNTNLQIVGAFEPDQKRRDLTSEQVVTFWDQPETAILSPETDILVFAEGASVELIAQGILKGKRTVVGCPWSFKSNELQQLWEAANSLKTLTTFAGFRRWASDFVGAYSAKSSGRIGKINYAHLCCWEMSLATDSDSNTVNEQCFHWLDQLLLLVDSVPKQVFARRSPDLDQNLNREIFIYLEFSNGCVAQIDLRTQSRLAHRTGWMLEGSQGSYRNHRLYTTMPDGEIVDEPLSVPSVSGDRFAEELVAACSGKSSTLPPLTDAIRVVRLIEQIERSAVTGKVVEFD